MRHSVVRLSVATLCLLLASPGAAQPGSRAELDQAQRDFDNGRYQEVITGLARVPDSDPLAREARFLRAYAHYKLGDLDQAELLLDRLLAEAFTPQVGLLRGMVAFERRHFRQALTRLEAVAASGERPWADTARELLRRVREEGLAAERAFAAAIDRAKSAITARRYPAAERHLARADRAMPGQHLPLYYRGYIAYQQKRHADAERLLRAALEVEPDDGWSKYMLALTLAATRRKAKARPLLSEVSRSRDPKLRKVAQQALEGLKPRKPRPPPPKNRLAAGLELGTGMDTNPYYVDELATDLEDTAFALQAAGRIGYMRLLSQASRLDVGLRLLERGYAHGGEGVEQTEVGVWTGLLLAWSVLEVNTYFNYALLLYGHEPLFSIYTAETEVAYPLWSWLSGFVVGRFSWRTVLDTERRHLEAIQAAGANGVRVKHDRFVIELAYEVYREWSDPVESRFVVTDERGGGPPAPEVVYTLRMDYSQLGHGPRLWGRVQLPWRLALTAGIEVQWRQFGIGDFLRWEVEGQPQQQLDMSRRHDVRIGAGAEISRQLPLGLQLALTFESVDNLSSLELEQPLVIDRNYSRRLVQLVLRWSWPQQ
jgi:tetratricopeptide (TPR) repeat protein